MSLRMTVVAFLFAFIWSGLLYTPRAQGNNGYRRCGYATLQFTVAREGYGVIDERRGP
jgi:hypothetical protein